MHARPESLRLAAIESSTDVGSVALFEGGAIVAEESVRAPGGHGETLLPAIHALFERMGWAPADVGRWGVGTGPGSFTGVRVAVALAKGIAAATGAELVGVTSLDAIAEGASGQGGLVVSLVGAGRGEVFVQATRAGRWVQPPAHWPPGEVCARVEGLARGEAVAVFGLAARGVDWSALGPRVSLVTEAPHDLPRAAAVGRIALLRGPDVAARLEPLYVMPPQITLPTGIRSAKA